MAMLIPLMISNLVHYIIEKMQTRRCDRVTRQEGIQITIIILNSPYIQTEI